MEQPTSRQSTSHAPPKQVGRHPIRGVNIRIESPGIDHSIDPRRQILADYCKVIGHRLLGRSIHHNTPAQLPPFQVPPLSPRQRQTLDGLLAGDSEKQIARTLGISVHTAHDHIRKLYKLFAVNSRGELLARFVTHTPYTPHQVTPN
jgi:DNA-binding CsgD family transcriptional regulator